MPHEHADFFGEAGAAVSLMAQKATQLAEMFRRGDIEAANQGLALLARELGDFVTMIGVIQGPLAVPSSELTIDGVAPDTQVASLSAWLETLVDAQARQDWRAIAGVLDDQLRPLVGGWKGVLQRRATGG